VRSVLVLVILAAAGCGGRRNAASEREIHVAAAANLTRAFNDIKPAFERQTGFHVIYSLGATAQLAQQIEHGAPFDVFAAADTEHIDRLARGGYVIPETKAVYARGKLVLWIPDGGGARILRIQDLAGPGVKHVALANPQLAPYGRAAVEALHALGLWEAVEPKLVYGQSVSTATQYAATGNVDAALTALALVYDRGGRRINVPENLHQPIDQAIAVVRDTKHADQARQFVAFVTSPAGREILKRYGYE
jgi:molybdate transport system substrate-binding protein